MAVWVASGIVEVVVAKVELNGGMVELLLLRRLRWWFELEVKNEV